MDYPDGAALAALAILGFFSFLIGVAIYVVTAYFLMKVFDKAGVQGKWRAWVPIYNFMVFSKLGDLNPWLVLIAGGAAIVLFWVPGLNGVLGLAMHVIALLAAWRVGLKLQKEAVWVILYFFLAPVWLGINAFDKSRWNLNVPAAPWAGNGFLSDTTTWAGIPSQAPAGGYPANPVTAPGYVAPAAPSAAPTPPPAAPSAAPEPPVAEPPTTEPPTTEPPKA
ncbi:large exoprotein [Microbacterium sp. T2.11-28]|uniref:large exoprotein n=1 Tax=unclassified Microbacterium TaxID=2609290 RepID=UPI002477544C|nr:large exoprotein [Microbacterium sp. T2.11-28]CAI9387853.1 hypothetical protein MICABA_02872 [Microbacterium sp. T2.11-28]